MRSAIEALLSFADDPEDLTEEEIREIWNTRRLLESLASPPETVEELERRIRELTGDGTDEAAEAGHLLRTITDKAMIKVVADSRRERIRAAWFAIVGMMEVERG